jgi:dihydroorotate dehydrogenase (fumarate)
MDLKTRYLGLELKNPIIAGASPLVDDLDSVRRLEDAGVGAIVMHSLFEEQIARDQETEILDRDLTADSSAEAQSYFPEPEDYRLGPQAYLDQVRRVKAAVSCPVIGSLNGSTGGGWVDYARQIQQAGADALELNLYFVSNAADETAQAVEARSLEVVKSVKAAVTVPVAVKLSPFFTSLRNFAASLDGAGVDGLVLFNRFYQPDIDIERLEAAPTLRLSDSGELLLRLRWMALLCGQVRASLALTGGVHTVEDVVKSVMAGADAVQVVSCLLKKGTGHARELREGLARWLSDHEYDSLAQARGTMSLLKSPDPDAFERANYMRVLNSWRAP